MSSEINITDNLNGKERIYSCINKHNFLLSVPSRLGQEPIMYQFMETMIYIGIRNGAFPYMAPCDFKKITKF